MLVSVCILSLPAVIIGLSVVMVTKCVLPSADTVNATSPGRVLAITLTSPADRLPVRLSVDTDSVACSNIKLPEKSQALVSSISGIRRTTINKTIFSKCYARPMYNKEISGVLYLLQVNNDILYNFSTENHKTYCYIQAGTFNEKYSNESY